MARTRVFEIAAEACEARSAELARILTECVAEGAAISFMAPFGAADAEAFLRRDVFPGVAAGARALFGAETEAGLVGTVQLILTLPPNQPHRCEIAKMAVRPDARRLGVGAALMTAALARARAAGKRLVTLDTRTGDVAERLYARLGFESAGVIPDFAFDPDGGALHGTTYMYRRL